MFHERTKHIDVRYHFVREIIACDDIPVSKVSTHDNLVDMMTKTLLLTKFEHYLVLIAEFSSLRIFVEVGVSYWKLVFSFSFPLWNSRPGGDC